MKQLQRLPLAANPSYLRTVILLFTCRTGLSKSIGLFCMLTVGVQSASAVDSSGRNSHFWITLRPNAATPSGTDEDVVLANGYRRVNLGSPDLSCKRVASGSNRVYQITWKGNDLIGSAAEETLQFRLLVEAGGRKVSLQSVKVDGESAATKGLILESSVSKVIPRKLNGRRPPKNYFEIHGAVVLRNPALDKEDPEHPFADLKNGHSFRQTPYPPTTEAKLKAFPEFSWDRVPRAILIRKTTAYKDFEIKAIADHYDVVVLEKANGAGQKSTMEGMLHTGARLKKINPGIKVLFYWNSRIFFGHYGIDSSIGKHRDEWIDTKFTIRDGLPTYDRNHPGFLKWWVGCAEKMIAHPQIDGTFVDKSGVPISMLEALYQATPDNTYSIQGGGGFSRNSEQFYFLSDAHYGDGSVKASMDSLDNTHQYARAGIMFRESLEADAPMVAMLRDPAGKMYLYYRAKRGAKTISAGAVDTAQGRYAMLIRNGDSFTGQCSSDGKNWNTISKVNVPMSDKIEAGMAVASHNPSSLATAKFSSFSRSETSKK